MSRGVREQKVPGQVASQPRWYLPLRRNRFAPLLPEALDFREGRERVGLSHALSARADISQPGLCTMQKKIVGPVSPQTGHSRMVTFFIADLLRASVPCIRSSHATARWRHACGALCCNLCARAWHVVGEHLSCRIAAMARRGSTTS